MISTETETLAVLRDRFKRRIGQFSATVSSSSESETAPTFSNNQIYEGINLGRRKVAQYFPSSKKWLHEVAVFQTTAAYLEYKLDYQVKKITSVWYDTTSEGKRQTTTVNAVDVVGNAGENGVVKDYFDAPSITNPKYRLCNIGIRLITSTDGTIAGSKYVRVEYDTIPATLNTEGEYSCFPNDLNDACIDYGIAILCVEAYPEIAQMAMQSFVQSAQLNLQENSNAI